MNLEDIMLDIARQINTARSYSHVGYKMAKLIKLWLPGAGRQKKKKKKEDVDQKDVNFNYNMNII